ncbi:MAG: hypothetical protein JST22_03850 [Bacteroidetes bacterium]|nr:hypothetical protein [Bacteroidota bacterium]
MMLLLAADGLSAQRVPRTCVTTSTSASLSNVVEGDEPSARGRQHRSITYYDRRGRVVEYVDLDGERTSRSHTRYYRRRGNCLDSVVGWRGNEVSDQEIYHWENDRRTARVEQYDGTGVRTVVSRRRYDDSGRVLEEDTQYLASGHRQRSRYAYDRLGRTIELEKTFSRLPSDSLSGMWDSTRAFPEYDAAGRLVRLRAVDYYPGRIQENSTLFAYDEHGRLSSVQSGYVGDSPLTTYRYDRAGHAVSEEWREAFHTGGGPSQRRSTTRVFDRDGRIVREQQRYGMGYEHVPGNCSTTENEWTSY